MKREHEILLGIIILILGIFILVQINSNMQEVCIENKFCFEVEIADSDEEKTNGLSNRNLLAENRGMLFIFLEEDFYGFWMKDMEFPLDIIWVDENKKIAGITKNFQPCNSDEQCLVVYPEEKIKYVLEINAGVSDKFNFARGDEIRID